MSQDIENMKMKLIVVFISEEKDRPNWNEGLKG